jgi:fatty acid desaturase
VGRLTSRPGDEPARDQAAGDPTTSVYRRSQVALAAAFVMLAGAVVAFALHARVIGIVLLVLMLLCGMGSFFFSVVFRNRAVAEARQARREQMARTAASRKSNRRQAQ